MIVFLNRHANFPKTVFHTWFICFTEQNHFKIVKRDPER